MMMTYWKKRNVSTTAVIAAVVFVAGATVHAEMMMGEEMGMMSDECSAALDDLMTNTEVFGAHDMFFADLVEACTKPDDMACTFDVSMETGVNVKMNACNMPQLDEYQTKCEASGYIFCNMSADVDATVEVDLLGVNAPVSIEPSCIPMCVPKECNPDDMEQMSPIQFSLDFAMDKVEEALDDLIDIEINITNTTVNMTIDCLETGVTVEEKGTPWIQRI